ncbi:MAG: hypothetical protein H7836_07585 [Magnetococcus sp. YQC-3]
MPDTPAVTDDAAKPLPKCNLLSGRKVRQSMTDHIVKECQQCGQLLRFPKNIGGMLMACPACGNKFSTDFRFGGVRKQEGVLVTMFEMPNKLIKRIGQFFSR